MLRWAARGVAMGGAPPEVVAAAAPQLAALGVTVKDNKDGTTTWTATP